MYQVSLEKFNGPLDLLLSLIEERKLAIGEVVLSQVTDQFLEYLKEVQENEHYQRVLADFLVVASRLILIKSRLLLPNCEKYAAFLRALPQIEKLEEKNLQRVVTLDQKMRELKTRITTAVGASFADLSGGVKNKIDVILNFLAVLMLFRARVLELSQNEIFGDIKIKQCAGI